MKKLNMLLLLVVASAFLSCEKDEPSPQINQRLTAIESDGNTITLSYDDQGRIETISGDGENFDIYYLADDIAGSITGDPPQGIKDQDLDEDRDVHVYNTITSNGNPVELHAYVIDYVLNPNTGFYDQVFEEIVIKVVYDNKTNPLHLVLSQSQMLPTIDDIVLGSADPAYAAFNAAGLFSVNNATKIEIFDNEGTLLEPATIISYQYDAAGLPTKAIHPDGGVVNFFYTTF